MRGQHRWVTCDHDSDGLMCDEEFSDEEFIGPDTGSVGWDVLEAAAREDGWTVKAGQHFCPHHSAVDDLLAAGIVAARAQRAAGINR